MRMPSSGNISTVSTALLTLGLSVGTGYALYEVGNAREALQTCQQTENDCSQESQDVDGLHIWYYLGTIGTVAAGVACYTFASPRPGTKRS